MWVPTQREGLKSKMRQPETNERVLPCAQSSFQGFPGLCLQNAPTQNLLSWSRVVPPAGTWDCDPPLEVFVTRVSGPAGAAVSPRWLGDVGHERVGQNQVWV